MKLLYAYLNQYKGLVLLALLLVAINQIFSFLDPYIFQKIIDGYVINKDGSLQAYSCVHLFLKAAGVLILVAMGVAMVSRIARAFQDYFINVITQRLGAGIYSDGLRHSPDMPFQVFEDQGSGETLGVMVEAGKHQQLLKQKGLYYAMWRQQIGERALSNNAAPIPVLS